MGLSMNTLIKILLSIIVFFTMLGADTASYNCVDIKDSKEEVIFNIDEDSIHTKYFVVNIKSTQYTKDKKSIATHFFMNKDKKGYVFGVRHYKLDSYYLQLMDYRPDDVIYEYDCKLESIIKFNGKAPLTMQGHTYNKQVLANFKNVRVINGN